MQSDRNTQVWRNKIRDKVSYPQGAKKSVPCPSISLTHTQSSSSSSLGSPEKTFSTPQSCQYWKDVSMEIQFKADTSKERKHNAGRGAGSIMKGNRSISVCFCFLWESRSLWPSRTGHLTSPPHCSGWHLNRIRAINLNVTKDGWVEAGAGGGSGGAKRAPAKPWRPEASELCDGCWRKFVICPSGSLAPLSSFS